MPGVQAARDGARPTAGRVQGSVGGLDGQPDLTARVEPHAGRRAGEPSASWRLDYSMSGVSPMGLIFPPNPTTTFLRNPS